MSDDITKADQEYDEWLDRARQAHEECQRALAANPDGGNCYKAHPLMIHSGQFWRCKHGLCFSCWQCALRHPIDYLRWHHIL